MKILLIGSGGREHAIAWRLRLDHPQLNLFIAPGNAGTAELGTNLAIAATDIPALLAWAQKEKPDFTIVGPEAPLCLGIVDQFEAAGCPIFGPNKAAARLEGSKVYAKELLLRHGLPTARGACFTDPLEAYRYSQKQAYPQVIKADGLAAGKGVIIAQTPWEATLALHQIMEERVFGEAGKAVVIEDFLPGRELSVLVLTDGVAHVTLPIAQDHKRLGDDDAGPNTGGMGAYAPAPFADQELHRQITEQIILPVLEAFRLEGLDFRGILYIGLIWTKSGPSILEFNVRGGDPETQVILPLLDTPLLPILKAVRERRLSGETVAFNLKKAVTIVLAAAGYPASPETGVVIEGLKTKLPDGAIFHAGTKLEGKRVVTAGGRVLSVTGWADDLATARQRAYALVEKIHFSGQQYRSDIAARLTLD